MLSGCAGMQAGNDLPLPPEPAAADSGIVEKACRSGRPFALVDFFAQRDPYLGHRSPATNGHSIDGDDISDVLHGDLLAKLIELSGKTVLAYGIDDPEDKHNAIPIPKILDALSHMIELIRAGAMPQPAAVVIAVEERKSLADLNAVFFEGRPEATTDTIAGKKGEIASKFKDVYHERPDYHDLYRLIRELKDMGIPLITAAGNDHSRTVNLLGIIGGTTIGALTPDGRIAPYSNRSSLTTIYRMGEITLRTEKEGVDINDDGEADFPWSMTSGGKGANNGARRNGTSFATGNVCAP